MAKPFKVITYCDFGTPTRKDILAKHYNFATAFRQYKILWTIYGRYNGRKEQWRVWQKEVTE